jgi:hypothetical protein
MSNRGLVAVRGGGAGFSLVEVALATGLFAFVTVGIIAMFPAGMKLQSFSSLESTAVNAARQILASVAVATNASEIRFVTGPDKSRVVTDLESTPLVLGFAAGSMVPERDFGGAGVWESGTQGDVSILVRAGLERRPDGLHLLRIEASTPAAAPLANRRLETFTTLVAFP